MPIDFNYAETMQPGAAGALVNTEPKTLISRTVETAAGIGFGKPVAQGDDDNGCIATAAGVTAILGVTVMDRGVSVKDSPDTFGQYESARIATKGVIWVEVGEAVAAGDPVYVTVAGGAFKKTATGNVAIANARWDSSAANGALAKLRLG